MTLRDILKTINTTERLDIIYRTNPPPHWAEQDLLAGICHYENRELISDDGDDYSLDDEVSMYELKGDTLIVWYESEWIINE